MELDLKCELLIRWLKKLPKTVAFDSHRMQDVYAPNVGMLQVINETFLGKVGWREIPISVCIRRLSYNRWARRKQRAITAPCDR